MKSAHIKRLYNRIGFGISPEQLARLSTMSKER